MEEEGPSVVLESLHFNISLEAGSLAVLSIPNEVVPKCAWWLVREYGSKKLNKRTFHSILVDDDGLSIVCTIQAVGVLQYLLRPEEFTLSPLHWRAFVINLTGTAYEVPGAVYCLANTLSKEGLSILHISTFEAEVFLIQEPDLDRACSILKQFEDPSKVQSLIDQAWQAGNGGAPPHKQRQSLSGHQKRPSASTTTLASAGNGEDAEETSRLAGETLPEEVEEDNDFDESWITPQGVADYPIDESFTASCMSLPALPLFKEGFTLCVLPNPLILAKLRDDADWAQCAPVLTKLLLYDERFTPLEQRLQRDLTTKTPDIDLSAAASFDNGDHDYHPSSLSSSTMASPIDADTRRARFMWGLWNDSREVTLLLEEDEIELFPPNMLITSPQQWRVIKLCGRPIAFDETGVVSAMSKVDAHIPSLNISTAITNCTLVPDELLETTVRKLSATLSCPVKYGIALSRSASDRDAGI